MANATQNLSPELYDYLKSVSLREPKVLRELRETTYQLDRAVMQISPEQGQFMRLLAQLIGAKKCIEVGVFTGYSTLSVALGLPDDGEIIACDVSEEWTAIARKYWLKAKQDHKIKLHLAPAQQTLQNLLDAGRADDFDFAFIDADKVNYDAYYELCLRLVRPGGLIVIDNVLWEGKVLDPHIVDPDTNAFQALNKKLLDDERVDISMLPMSDGVTLVRRRF